LYHREGANSAQYGMNVIKPSHIEVAVLPHMSVPLSLLSWKTSLPTAIFPR